MTAATSDRRHRRYRRRILGWGSACLLLVFAVGATVSLQRVEDDLQTGVTEAVRAQGIAGVAVSFSGQDGVLHCSEPLSPDEQSAAREAAEGVRGVRTVDLDDSCAGDEPAGNGDGGGGPAVTASPTVPEGSTTSPEQTLPVTASTATSAATTSAPVTTTEPSSTTTLPGANDVVQLIADDPQFTMLENALVATGLAETLAGEGPFTVFAPTDDAFEALGPVVTGELNADPETLRAVLEAHVAPGRVLVGDLSEGPLSMLDGSQVQVSLSPGVTLVYGDTSAGVVDPDLVAFNGVVHVVDGVLLPAELDLDVPVPDPLLFATLDAGVLTIEGTVGDAADRSRLVEAATTGLDPTNVVADDLVVDDEAPADAVASEDALTSFSIALATMPEALVRGEVRLDPAELLVTGVVVDAAGRRAFDELPADPPALVELADRDTAAGDDAIAVERRLDELVADTPLRFPPGSAALLGDPAATLDQLAAAAKEFAGLVVGVRGHSDSGGSDLVNLFLSQARAETVAAELIARGVPAEQLDPIGQAASNPIVVDGVEDPAASRRVDFAVAVQ